MHIISTKDKLLKRLLSHPKDFTFDEARRLLAQFGYQEDHQGKTSGSRVAFVHQQDKHIIRMHKPHPENIMKLYAIDDLIDALESHGDI